MVLQLASNPEPVQKILVTFLPTSPRIMLDEQLTIGHFHALAVLQILTTFSFHMGETRLVSTLVMLLMQES